MKPVAYCYFNNGAPSDQLIMWPIDMMPYPDWFTHMSCHRRLRIRYDDGTECVFRREGDRTVARPVRSA